MQLRGFSPRTQYKYLAHLRQFEEFFHRSAEELGQEELKNFFLYLIKEKNISRSYANGVCRGLKSFSQLPFVATLDSYDAGADDFPAPIGY